VKSAIPTRLASNLIPPLALTTLGVAAVAYLLARYPYDGMYGQDTYAYYGQALAWWREMRSDPPPEFAFYTSQAFRWPVGYHLHVMLGFLFGGTGPWGGWALNLAMMALCPTLVYTLVRGLFPDIPRITRLIAGTLAGGLLLASGTYMRFGLSLMADVPALFWGLIGLNAAVRAWPPNGGTRENRRGWALLSGLALGLAVLNRYGALLLLPPLFAYLIVRRRTGRVEPQVGALRSAGLAFAGFVVALLPQVAYLLTHESGAGYSAFISDWSPSNLFASTLSSTDGTLTYGMPMLAFFVVTPLISAEAGFLSLSLLPALVVGSVYVCRARAWPAPAFLFVWWLGSVLLYSGTPYQAHRFVILYLPALTIIIGLGVAYSSRVFLGTNAPRLLRACALLLVLSAGAGVVHGWLGVERWVGTHANFKREEQAVLALVRDAAQGGLPPHLVAFGQTAALHHYTGWPALDLYNHDRDSLAPFLAASRPRLIIVPEDSLRTQWVGTPTGERWEWLKATYSLTLQGRAGQYSVYRVGP
jgi:hypothetical protein